MYGNVAYPRLEAFESSIKIKLRENKTHTHLKQTTEHLSISTFTFLFF